MIGTMWLRMEYIAVLNRGNRYTVRVNPTSSHIRYCTQRRLIMPMYYYDLCDDTYGEMMNEDMLHAMSNGHVSKHTLLFHYEDDLNTLLKYFNKYGYRTRYDREVMHEPAWWHLHCIHIVERVKEPFTDDKEEI